jgi:hypothetical protein
VFEDEGAGGDPAPPGAGGAVGRGRPVVSGRGAVLFPDLLARKHACQALLIEEFALAGPPSARSTLPS